MKYGLKLGNIFYNNIEEDVVVTYNSKDKLEKGTIKSLFESCYEYQDWIDQKTGQHFSWKEGIKICNLSGEEVEDFIFVVKNNLSKENETFEIVEEDGVTFLPETEQNIFETNK